MFFLVAGGRVTEAMLYQCWMINFLFFSVVHAELNAVLNRNAADVKKCSIYSTLFPCNECAKVIIQSGTPLTTNKQTNKQVEVQ
jgi:deoxycytidylate deaminase